MNFWSRHVLAPVSMNEISKFRVKAKERLREIVETLPGTRAAVEAKRLLATLE